MVENPWPSLLPKPEEWWAGLQAFRLTYPSPIVAWLTCQPGQEDTAVGPSLWQECHPDPLPSSSTPVQKIHFSKTARQPPRVRPATLLLPSPNSWFLSLQASGPMSSPPEISDSRASGVPRSGIPTVPVLPIPTSTECPVVMKICVPRAWHVSAQFMTVKQIHASKTRM